MALLFAPLFFIAVVLYVAWPLFQERLAEDGDSESGNLEVLEEKKELLVADLKDVEMDYRMGKLSSEDYERLKGDLEHRAMTVLQEIDKTQKTAPRR